MKSNYQISKTKILSYAIFWLMLLKTCPIYSQVYITGHSDLFEIGEQMHGYPSIINYSGVFSFGDKKNEYPDIIGHSVIFNINTRGNYLANYSDQFLLNTLSSELLASFAALKTDVMINEPVHFLDLSIGDPPPNSWTWNFGDGSLVSNLQNPVHTFTNPGTYSVKLTVFNELEMEKTVEKPLYINVGSQSDGIDLQIVKTDPHSGPEIAWVGYTFSMGKFFNFDLPLWFPVDEEGNASIDFFPTQDDMDWTLTSAFNNKLILFCEDQNRIGHIHFEYDPETQQGLRRNALLILHNDSEILEDENGTAFPYAQGTTEYDRSWGYYSTGEYPVSMFIPPRNEFAYSYSKTPLVLIHGWEGRFEQKKYPDAYPPETSYWFTTAESLNTPGSLFDAWQFYYPYNSAHNHLAVILKSGLEYLKNTYYGNDRLRLVTHSMGGLITLRYLTQFQPSAISTVERVLFSAPPAHGSLGANYYYKTRYNRRLEYLIGYDSNAPAVRDMKLGSDAVFEIYNTPLPVLNGNSLYDDYFVLLGTTYKFYLSDAYYQTYINPYLTLLPHACVFEESVNHHDGIVSISSGSLLNKGVGFATFHGNHNDAVHMQSFIRGDQTNQNIGSSSLLPDIITSYFTNDYTSFINEISTYEDITAIVEHDRTVFKPENQTLSNLDTNNGVNYQKGIVTLGFSDLPSASTLRAYYKSDDNILSVSDRKLTGHGDYIGFFRLNVDSESKHYYFNMQPTGMVEILTLGNTLPLNEGGNLLLLWDNRQVVAMDTMVFRYCETRFKHLEVEGVRSDPAQNYTDTRHKNVVHVDRDTHKTAFSRFYVDDQASLVDFRISFIESVIYDIPVEMKIMLPDGSIHSTDYPGSVYSHNESIGRFSLQLPEPEPGEWQVWIESSLPGVDTLEYTSIAYLLSDIYAYLPDTIDVLPGGTNHSLQVGLQVDDFELTEEIEVLATVYKPDFETEIFDITSNVTAQDTAYVITFDYVFEMPGDYQIKYNIDGVYNNYNFERCLHQSVTIVDTIPVLAIPDVVFRQNQNHLALNLAQYLHNVNDYDTLYFSKEVLSTNLDSLSFSATLDSLALSSHISTNLSDTGSVVLRYIAHIDQLTISDTVRVNVLLPELYFQQIELSDHILSNGSEVILDYSINNSGTIRPGTYNVSYYISADSIISPSDYCIGTKTIISHPADSIITLGDTIIIPNLPLSGNYYLLASIDPNNHIIEIDKTNNLEIFEISLNLAPQAPLLVSATPDVESVHLEWTPGSPTGITGYIIHYGTDPESLEKIYTYNTDTTYTVTGIYCDTYYFAVSAYKMIGVDSELSNILQAAPIYTPSIPSSIAADDITYHSALISWTPGGNEPVWDILYGLAGFDPDSEGTLIESIADNPYMLSGLNPETAYDVYVRAVCGEHISDWSVPITFTTGEHDIPNDLPLSGIVSDDETECFDALQTITVYDFTVEAGGSATLIAGESIHLLPGTTVEHGGYLLARIAAHEDDYCGIPRAIEITKEPVTSKEEEDVVLADFNYEIRKNGFFKLYPNPTDGTFTLELTTAEPEQGITIDVYGMLGSRLFTKELPPQRLHTLSLEGQQPGMYIIRVMKGDRVGVERLIKR